MYSTNSWWPWKVILPVESPLHLPFKILISKDLHIYSRILPWSFKCWSRFFCDRTIFVKGRLLPGAKITRNENDKIIFYTSNKGILLVKCNKNHNTTYLSFWKRICQVYIIHNLGYLKKCDIGTNTFLLKFRPPPENLRFCSVRFSWGGGGELIAIISQFGISSFSKLQWFFALEIYAPLNSLILDLWVMKL